MCEKYDDIFPELDDILNNPNKRKCIEENQSLYLEETPEEEELNDRQYKIIKEKREKAREKDED